MKSGLVTEDQVRGYREQGFVHVRGVFTGEETARFRAAAVELAADGLAERQRTEPGKRAPIFVTTSVSFEGGSVRVANAALRDLTFHPRVAAIAEELAGGPLRCWISGTAIKEAGNTATGIHDDESQYPFTNSPNTMTVWVPMDDLPVERGCLVFLPGSHRRGAPATERPAVGWAGDEVFRGWPELAWWPRVTVPIRAGDCTFHHARMMHMATPNVSDDIRIAHAATYIDAAATYRATPFGGALGDPLGYETGTPLDMLPLIGND